MIRFAQQSDNERVKALWEICFPDEGGFNPWFFERVYRPEYTLLCVQDGEIAAMLQMLPFEIQVGAERKAVTYIYGACTAPQHRRKHLMAHLLEESFRLDRAQGRAASVLIPQEEWLFGFYEKFGYQIGFTVSSREIMCRHKNDAVKAYRLTDADIKQISKLYDKIHASKVVRDENFWKTQLDLFRSVGLGAFGLQKGGRLTAAAFCWRTEQGTWIQELLSETPEDGHVLAEQIGAQHGGSLKITQNGDDTPLGCIKFYDSKWMNGYMNLMFN